MDAEGGIEHPEEIPRHHDTGVLGVAGVEAGLVSQGQNRVGRELLE
jgi:hypothetical protein